MFNKPWMDKINPDLLIRYWRRKGSPEPIRVKKYGVTFILSKTVFGEVARKETNLGHLIHCAKRPFKN